MTQTMITIPKMEVATLKAVVTAKHNTLSEEYTHIYNLLSIQDKRLSLVCENTKEYIQDPVRFQHRMETETIAPKTIVKRPGFFGLFSKAKYIPEQKKVTYTAATPGTVRSDIKNHVLNIKQLAGYPGILKKLTVEETQWSRMCPISVSRGFELPDHVLITAYTGTCHIVVEITLSEEHLKLRSRLDEITSEKADLDSILADLDLAAQYDRDIHMPINDYAKAKAVKCEK